MTTEKNADRLLMIKLNHEGLVAYTADIGSDVIDLPRINSDMAFLIERVQEMEKDIDFFKKRKRLNDQVIQELAELKDERVRKVLTKVRTVV